MHTDTVRVLGKLTITRRLVAHLLHHVRVTHHPVRTHDELRLRVPLVVGYVEARLQPDPLLAFGKKSIVAGRSLTFLHQCFMTSHHLFQIVKMIIVIPGSSQHFKREVADDGWRTVVEEQELPLEAVPGGELTFRVVHDGHFADQLGRLQTPGADEHEPRVGVTRVAAKAGCRHERFCVDVASEVACELDVLVRYIRPIVDRPPLDVARERDLVLPTDARLQRVHHRRRVQKNVVQVVLIVLVHHIVDGHV